MIAQAQDPYLQLALEFGGESIGFNFIDSKFNVEFANALAEIEAYNKHLYRPNTYLHKWWARRCGTTFRAILKHLVRDQAKQDFYAPGGLEGQIILDPMMGGGTTLHEAIRLGANVVGSDIDPIPVLQARATLTDVPMPELTRAFEGLLAALQTRLMHLYQTACPSCGQQCQQRFMLYGLRRRCSCQEVLLVDDYILRHNADDSVVRIDPETYNILWDNQTISRSLGLNPWPLLLKGQDTCSCGERLVDDLTVPYSQRFVPVAVAGECAEHGFFFAAPQQLDLELLDQADNQRTQVSFAHSDFVVISGPKSRDLLNRAIDNYLDLFSSRQLLFFDQAMGLLKQVEPALRLKLAMLLSTATEFNSMLCGYKGAGKSRPGAIRHTFAHHAYTFPYTALENNPLHGSRSSGTLENLFQSRLVRGYTWAMRPIERRVNGNRTSQIAISGEIDAGREVYDVADLQQGRRRFLLLHGSSIELDLPDNSIDHVVTDPPYFDSVQYSDLAGFFRVWLRQMLPTEVRWDYSLAEAAVDQQAGGNGQYEDVLGGIFRECHRVLKKEHGRLIFTFHHWNPNGWAGLTLALRRAGFRLINRYVIHAENPTSVHIINQRSLVHDVVLVLGAVQSDDAGLWQLPEAVDKTDSYAFCEQCGSVLGYLLDQPGPESEIRMMWNRLLG
jgi:putative DNA methylase